MEVDNCSVPMEVDTGASVSIMAEATYYKLWPGWGLSTTYIRLQTYSKEPITVVGSVNVQVSYDGQTAQITFSGCQGRWAHPPGKELVEQNSIKLEQIHHSSSPGLSELLSTYDEVFQEGLGTLRGDEATIEVDPEATPRFCKARTMP